MSTQKYKLPQARRGLLGLGVMALVAFGLADSLAAANRVLIEGHPADATRIIAKFKSDQDAGNAGRRLEQLGSRSIHSFRRLPNLVLLDDVDAVPANANAAQQAARLENRLQALRNSGLFEYVEPDYLHELTLAPNDQAYANGNMWGQNNTGLFGGDVNADISTAEAWNITTGSTNVIVAVIDTGIRFTHQDLSTNMWRNPGEIAGNGVDDDGNGFVDDVHGINALVLTGNPMDDNGHGTHVAGTIGAIGNNGPSANTRAVGVCWRVQLMGIKIFDASGLGGAVSAAIIGIDYAVENGAKVLNNSWGGGAFSRALFDAISRARSAGVLFVAGAGNDGINNDVFPFYPANYNLDNVISVAASDRYDNLADFSHYGATTVDLAAPGVDILSTWYTADTEFFTESGTSMATPHVSGVAALILSQFRGADIAELRGRLLGGVDPLDTLEGRTVTGGRLNAYGALTLAGNGVLQARITPPSGATLLAGSAQRIFVEVTEPPVSVSNATVTGSVTGIGNLTFLNNGVAPDAVANDRIYTATLNVPAATNDLTLSVDASSPGKTGTSASATYSVLPPPVNDYFTNAVKAPLAGATYRENNQFGTVETGEPRHAGVQGSAASLWWNYTPAQTVAVYLDSLGSAVDTVLGVYVGNSVGNLSVVASNNNVGPVRQAALTFTAVAGNTYRIALGSANTNQVGSLQLRLAPGGGPDITPPQVFMSSPLNGQIVITNLVDVTGTAIDPVLNSSGISEVQISVNGGFSMTASGTTNWQLLVALDEGLNSVRAQAVDAAGNVSPPVVVQVNYFIPGPTNDFFVNGTTLGTSPGSSVANSSTATAEAGEPRHAGVNGNKSLWWKFTPTQDGTLHLSTLGSSFDTLLAVYTGDTVSTLTPVIANDDASPNVPGGYSRLAVGTRANQTYRIAVDGYDGLAGSLVLSNFFVPSPLFQLTVNSGPGGTAAPAFLEVGDGTAVTIIAQPAANYLFDMWTGDVVSLANPLNLVVTSNTTIVAQFRPEVFTEGFESGDFSHLPWVAGGNLPWLVRTNTVAAGQFAARSGVISHNQSSSLRFVGDFQDGQISFAYKVSSELGFDVLKFLVDGVVREQWSGQVGWADFTYPITAGQHTLEWRYVKDLSLSSGADAAYLDNVNLPLVVDDSPVFRPELDIQLLADGTTLVDLTGQPGQAYVFQASADMINWQSFATNVAVGGFTRAVDAGSDAKPRNYFRAIIPAQP